MRAPVGFATSLVVLGVNTAVALAHPDLDEGRTLMEDADFEGALDRFSSARRSGELSRTELVELFELSALAHYARRQRATAGQALSRLLTLEPNFTFSTPVPPELQRLLDQARERSEGALEIEVHLDNAEDRFVLRVELQNDLDLVDSVRMFARVGSDWRSVEGRSWELPSEAHVGVQYYAEAYDRHGVLLARDGSESSPLGDSPGDVLASNSDIRAVDGQDAALAAASQSSGGEDTSWLWWVGGIGGAIALGAIVTLIVVLAGDGESDADVRLNGPTIEF